MIEKIDNRDSNHTFSIEYESSRDSQYNTALKCLYYKDLSGMNDKSYHVFRLGTGLVPKLSPISWLKRIRKRYGINIDVKPLSTGKPILFCYYRKTHILIMIFFLLKGFYIDPIMAIRNRLEVLLNRLSIPQIKNLGKILIKVSCDGTSLSRNVKVVNLVFNLLIKSLRLP